MDPRDRDRLIEGSHHDPHAVLGAHSVSGATVVRTLKPDARAITVISASGGDEPQRTSMTLVGDGIWECALADEHSPSYSLLIEYDGGTYSTADAYAFEPVLGEVDLHLIAEGRHEQLWRCLGAHPRRIDSRHGTVAGTSFAVWAPNALGVRVVGDFNFWDGRGHPMRSLGSSGVWEIFVPSVSSGAKYKFQILGKDRRWHEKADPFAFFAEVPPATASVVYESRYAWGDQHWLAHRASSDPHAAPMSIYEVHLGSWRSGMGYRDLADALITYLSDLGFTHVELLPVSEHPYGPSWGYQVSGYFAPTSRLGSPDDFRYFVDRLHQAGIGVLMDWVPAHFPKDNWALAKFDGTALYEHPDPSRGEQPDWGTYVFDFGRPEVRNFLVSNALYWLEEFHIDGLRVDAVASMLYLDYSREPGGWQPNIHGGRENLEASQFLQELNATAYKRVPGVVTIAEESTSWPGVTARTDAGGLGFGFKWNMGWMNDSLGYMQRDPIYRKFHHHEMTFAMMYAYSENFVLPLSHDEVVHGKRSLIEKMPGDRWQKLANLRAYLAFMWAHPGKKLLFMGSEFAQSDEWSSEGELHWWLLDHAEHQGIASTVRDLNRIYRENATLWELDSDPLGFEWVSAEDAQDNTFTWLRRDVAGNYLAALVNFSPVPRIGVRLGTPRPGVWTEVLNTDSTYYGGSGMGNSGSVLAEPVEWAGQPASCLVTIPPLAACYFVSPSLH